MHCLAAKARAVARELGVDTYCGGLKPVSVLTKHEARGGGGDRSAIDSLQEK